MASIHPNDEDLRLLRIEQVLELVPIARSSLYRAVNSGDFPAPIKQGSVSLWSNEEIRAWLRKCLGARGRRDNGDLV